MAFALSLHIGCDAIHCKKTAAFTVYRNLGRPQDRYGVYCAKHTTQRLKMLRDPETKTSSSVCTGQHDAVRERLKA